MIPLPVVQGDYCMQEITFIRIKSKILINVISCLYAYDSFSFAMESISLMRFCWLTRVAPGS